MWNKRKLTLPTPEEALAGRDTPIIPRGEHVVLGVPMTPPYPENTAVCYFGMGCFWGAEKLSGECEWLCDHMSRRVIGEIQLLLA